MTLAASSELSEGIPDSIVNPTTLPPIHAIIAALPVFFMYSMLGSVPDCA